jgi:hypothetical protein
MKTFQEFDANLGIKTELHEDGGKVVIAKKWDAEPLLEACAAERAATSGQKWGEMRKVGSIPMAELAKMMRQDGSIDAQRCMAWIKANPAFATFEKVLIK